MACERAGVRRLSNSWRGGKRGKVKMACPAFVLSTDIVQAPLIIHAACRSVQNAHACNVAASETLCKPGFRMKRVR